MLCRTQKYGRKEVVGVSTAFKPYSDSVSLRVKFTQNFTILKWRSNVKIGQCSQLCLFCLPASVSSLTDPPIVLSVSPALPVSAVCNRAILLTVLGKGQHSFVVD